MKKLFLILLPLLFVSCNSGYFTGIYDYEFINNSSVDVDINIQNGKTYTLQTSKSIVVTKDRDDKYTFINNPRVKAREVCRDWEKGYYVYIEDMYYTNMKFFNSSNYDIIVTEQNGMLGNNYGDVLNISAGATVTAKVYTTSPAFISVFSDNNMPADKVLSISPLF